MREFLKTVLYGMGIVLVFSLTRFTLQLTRDFHRTAVQAQRTLTEAESTIRGVKLVALDKKNGLPATLEETRETVRQARKLVDVALKTSLTERANIQKASDESVDLIARADRLVENLDYRTRVVADSINMTAGQAQLTLSQSSKAMDAAAGLMGDPQIHNTLTNLATTSNNAALMSSDAQIKFHSVLFPPKQPWYMRTLNVFKVGGQLGWEALTLAK